MTATSLITTDERSRLDAWNRRFRWPIVIAAIAPFTGALLPVEFETTTALIIDLGSWAIFAVDLGVRLSITRRYLRTGAGVLDVAIVVFTFPWYILPGWDGTSFLAIFRVVRLITVFMTGKTARRLHYLYDKLGVLGLVSLIVISIASLIVLQVEPPEAGFDDLGDAVWWSVVTITTVGYGDLVPETSAGRFAGLLLMLVGLAALGTVAGALTSMFRGAAEEEAEAADPDSQVADDEESELAEIKRRLDDLGRKIDQLGERLP